MILNFATSNQGKLDEVKARLSKVDVRRLDLHYPEVQASSIVEVVEYGLQWISERTDKDVMIEDSGLFIDYLKGFPGVFSSYVYKSIGCEGVLDLMRGVEGREAQFRSCIGLLLDGNKKILEGECRGVIAMEAKGHQGFGFDPIFIPDGHSATFAEMELSAKNEISHRGNSLDKTEEFLNRLKGI
jgi:XTP/dITP diphosphohydrolase